MEQVRRLVEAAIVASPFGRRLGVVGEEIERDRVRLRLPFAGELVTIGDMVHGGAIAGLVDVAATAACWADPSIAPGARGTTVGLELHYLNAGRGQDLVATATVLQRGRSIAVAEIDVRGADGLAVAKATATYKLSAPPEKPSDDPAQAMVALFAGRADGERRAILARLERAGAALYRALAGEERDPLAAKALLEAAEREEANATLLESGAAPR